MSVVEYTDMACAHMFTVQFLQLFCVFEIFHNKILEEGPPIPESVLPFCCSLPKPHCLLVLAAYWTNFQSLIIKDNPFSCQVRPDEQ